MGIIVVGSREITDGPTRCVDNSVLLSIDSKGIGGVLKRDSGKGVVKKRRSIVLL